MVIGKLRRRSILINPARSTKLFGDPEQ